VNKDTDDLYTEWVHFDEDRFRVLMARAERLVGMTEPPPRISEDAAYFVCKMCSFWKHCHNGQAAEVNCRTCCRSTPVENAAWQCQLDNQEITPELQKLGCQHHLMIPALVPYGEATDGGENWVAYKHKDNGLYFVNGPEGCSDYGPVFSSKELHNCNGTLMADVIATKNEIPGSKVVSGTTNGPDHTTMWDDIATNPDDIPVKADHPAKQEERAKIKRTVKAMEGFKK
jgi:hypothetical protein